MGVELLTSDYIKDQAISKMANADGERVQRVETNDINVFSGFEPAEAPSGANGSMKAHDKRQEIAVDNGVPKDVKDEWPEVQVCTFYFVRIRSYEDPQLKLKIDQAYRDEYNKNQARQEILEKLRAKKQERAEVIEKLKPLTSQEKAYRKSLDEKKREMEPLRTNLGNLRNANVMGICSSEEELNRRIQNLQFRIEHDNNTLVEEKQMIREIRQLESTREKVLAHEAVQAKLQETMGQKEDIQDRFKLLGEDLDALRKEQQAAWNRIKPLEEDLQTVDKEINSLHEKLDAATDKRKKAKETIEQLKEDHRALNASYYQNSNILKAAQHLASKGDKAALEELSQNEVEKFMSLWKSSKTFREDYEKKSSAYLFKDSQQRNPDEVKLISDGGAGLRSNIGRENIKKENVLTKETKHLTDDAFLDLSGASKENHKQVTGSAKGKLTSKPTNIHESEMITETDVVSKHHTTNDEVDAVLLKEKRREEEIAKAKLAQERKNRHIEKLRAKAESKAQKEAEKKLKEREKKARKKAAAAQASITEEALNTEVETANGADDPEPKIAEDTQEQKELKINEKPRPRKRDIMSKSKGKPSFPKSALKKKQSFPSWIWVGVPILLLVLVLFAIYYYYVL